MKVLFNLFMPVVLGFLASHGFSASQDLKEWVDTSKVHRITGYETALKCTYADKRDDAGKIYGAAPHLKQRQLSQATMIFDILDENEKAIGYILAEWYPDSTPYPNSQVGKILRLRHLWVGEDSSGFSDPIHQLQKKGHGTRALETLFTVWRTSKLFPEGTEVWLECQTFKPHLSPWYEKFGFKKMVTPGELWGDVAYMSVPLNKTKFPFQAKLKKQKAEAAGHN